MHQIKFFSFLLFFFIFSEAKANDVKDWLNKEIDIIISAYQNTNLPNENKFLMIEQVSTRKQS